MFRFEHRRQKLASRVVFARRVLLSLGIAVGFIAVSLIGGIAGYMAFAGLSLVDAFLNASMILGGMGPVAALESDGAKVFAGLYALYSGLLLIAVTGVVLAPVFHRVLHAIHADEG
jgi:hypothetical protein